MGPGLRFAFSRDGADLIKQLLVRPIVGRGRKVAVFELLEYAGVDLVCIEPRASGAFEIDHTAITLQTVAGSIGQRDILKALADPGFSRGVHGFADGAITG